MSTSSSQALTLWTSLPWVCEQRPSHRLFPSLPIELNFSENSFPSFSFGHQFHGLCHSNCQLSKRKISILLQPNYNFCRQKSGRELYDLSATNIIWSLIPKRRRFVEFDQSSVVPITSPTIDLAIRLRRCSSSPFLIHLVSHPPGPSPSRFFGASSTLPKNNFRMATAKKMRRLPPPKRALLELYSPSIDTCTPYPEGLAADGFEPIGPSLSEINVLSRSETIAPSPFQTNEPHGFEIYEVSPSETHAPSPQSQTSGAGASSSRRVRGPTVGKATAKRVANNNGNKLHIPIIETFNTFEGVLATPGANEIDIQIRRMCPIQGVKSWTVADLAAKGAVVQAVQVFRHQTGARSVG